MFERASWTGEGHCLGPVVVGRQWSEVTDQRGPKPGESESMDDSKSAAKFSSESESRSSFRRFFSRRREEEEEGSGDEAKEIKRNQPSVR